MYVSAGGKKWGHPCGWTISATTLSDDEMTEKIREQLYVYISSCGARTSLIESTPLVVNVHSFFPLSPLRPCVLPRPLCFSIRFSAFSSLSLLCAAKWLRGCRYYAYIHDPLGLRRPRREISCRVQSAVPITPAENGAARARRSGPLFFVFACVYIYICV